MTSDIDQHRLLAVAPMMELTDRHFRYLARLLSRHTLLYTEMLTSAAVLHGDRDYLLGKHICEGPVALQLGGSDPQQMAQAAVIGEQWGYQEINMNVGCPSDRVKAGRFGACLMAEPVLVRQVVEAMQAAVKVPVTVKCRLGVDRQDSYEACAAFVNTVADSGCRHFIVHARKAWLDGLSPKENRDIPPLRYHHVYRLKSEFPHLHISINGGVQSISQVQDQLNKVDGVMVGRSAYHQCSMLATADRTVFAHLPDGHVHEPSLESLSQVAREYAVYMQSWLDRGVRLTSLSRHLIPLFQQIPGAKQWRRHLSEQASRVSDAVTLVEDALLHLHQAQRRSA